MMMTTIFALGSAEGDCPGAKIFEKSVDKLFSICYT